MHSHGYTCILEVGGNSRQITVVLQALGYSSLQKGSAAQQGVCYRYYVHFIKDRHALAA